MFCSGGSKIGPAMLVSGEQGYLMGCFENCYQWVAVLDLKVLPPGSIYPGISG